MQTTNSGKYQVMIPDTSSECPGLKPKRKLTVNMSALSFHF